jgi:hypothetical protein
MMRDFDKIREVCKRVNDISSAVIDEFLLYYAARRDKLDHDFETKFSRFKNSVSGMPSNWYGLIKAQYIVHRIFKEKGLIHKYLNHVAIRQLEAEKEDYLKQAAQHPWRFTFSEIVGNPSKDFYEMEDVFSGETFLLYSPSISQLLSEQSVLLWFNLISFNGECWQSFGPVAAFKSFDGDDVFFYATELRDSIGSEEDLLADLDDNPVPYMMLAIGSNYPLVVNSGLEVVQVLSENYPSSFDLQLLKKDFHIEQQKGVYKLTQATLSAPPYFAEAYYDEKRQILLLFALSDQGYDQMALKLQRHQLMTSDMPEVRVHLPMLTVTKQLLKKNIELNPYSQRFETKPSPANEIMMDKLNELLMIAMQDINAGKRPDVETLAKKFGIDREEVNELLRHVMDRTSQLRK